MEPLAQAAEEMAHFREMLARHERELAELKEKLARYEAPPLLTPREFCRRYGWKPGELRGKLAARGTNGLEAAVIQERRNGKLLIDPTKFFEILKNSRTRRRRR